MDLDKTVNGWFEETFTQMKESGKLIRPLDLLLVGVLHCARKYCNAIIVLLHNHHKMPAAALLRILCELYVNLLWYFRVPDKGGTTADDDCIYRRLRRWDYKRVVEHERMLRNVRTVASGDHTQEVDKALKEIQKQKAEYKNQGLRCMPDTAGIFRELPKDWAGQVYPKIYQYFGRAVHLDLVLIREMVQHSPGQIQCFSDPPSYGPNELLSYCINMGCDVNRLIRRHYGFDSEQIQIEYESLSNELQSRK